MLNDFNDISIGVVCVDPSKKKTGGALLGDRIRMNSAYDKRVYMGLWLLENLICHYQKYFRYVIGYEVCKF